MPGVFPETHPPLNANDCRATFAALRIEKYVDRFLAEEMEPADILLLPSIEQAAFIPALGPRLRLFDFLLRECPRDPRVARFRQICASSPAPFAAPEPSHLFRAHPAALSTVFSTPERREFALQLADGFFPCGVEAPTKNGAGAVFKNGTAINSKVYGFNDIEKTDRDGLERDENAYNDFIPCENAEKQLSAAAADSHADDSESPAESRHREKPAPRRSEKQESEPPKTNGPSGKPPQPLNKKAKASDAPAEFEGELIFYDHLRGFGFCALLAIPFPENAGSSAADGFPTPGSQSVCPPVDVYFNGSALLVPEGCVLDKVRLTFNIRISATKAGGPFRDGHVVRMADGPEVKALLASVAGGAKDSKSRTPLTAVNIRAKDVEVSAQKVFGEVDSVGPSFGFICSDAGEKVHFSKKNVARECAEKIAKGDRVSFYANRHKTAEAGERGGMAVTATEVCLCKEKRPPKTWRKVETMTKSQRALFGKSGGERAAAGGRRELDI